MADDLDAQAQRDLLNGATADAEVASEVLPLFEELTPIPESQQEVHCRFHLPQKRT